MVRTLSCLRDGLGKIYALQLGKRKDNVEGMAVDFYMNPVLMMSTKPWPRKADLPIVVGLGFPLNEAVRQTHLD